MLRLILRNLWQKKGRTVFTVLGLAIATGTLCSLLAFRHGYERGLQRELDQLGAHILVVPKGCPYDAASLALHGANWPCYLKESYLQQVMQSRGVAHAAPVLMAAHYGANREILSGITSEYLQLRPLWRIHGTFCSGEEVLLGAAAAHRLNASVGSTVHLNVLKRDVRVAGILEPTSAPDDDFMFIPLATAQMFLKRPAQLTHILVKLASPDLLENTVQSLRGCDAGMQMNIVPLAHLFETIRHVSAAAQYLLTALSAIAFLIAGTAVANTMFMAVLERTREIGVLRALGASTIQIFCLFSGEAFAVGTLGTLLGLSGALIGSRLIESWARAQIAYAPNSHLISFDPGAMLLATAFGLALTLVAAFGPALRAARLAPVEAFRAQAAY